MSRYKTDPLVMGRVRQILYDTGLTNKELGDALGLNANTIGSWLSDEQIQNRPAGDGAGAADPL